MNKLCCQVNPSYGCTRCDWTLCRPCMGPEIQPPGNINKLHQQTSPGCKGFWFIGNYLLGSFEYE